MSWEKGSKGTCFGIHTQLEESEAKKLAFCLCTGLVLLQSVTPWRLTDHLQNKTVLMVLSHGNGYAYKDTGEPACTWSFLLSWLSLSSYIIWDTWLSLHVCLRWAMMFLSFFLWDCFPLAPPPLPSAFRTLRPIEQIHLCTHTHTCSLQST